MAAPKDYYKILELDDKADAAAIKSAYRRLARKYHPDISGKANEEKFKDINEAYEVLSDPAKRQEYDRLRRGFFDSQARSRGPGYERVSTEWNFDDIGRIFEDLFSPGQTADARPGTRQPPEETITLTLEQISRDSVVSVTVEQPVPCPVCHGRRLDCARCGGSGVVMQPAKFDVNIPAGLEDGTVLRVGEHARLKVHIAPHPRFVRQGTHLKGRLMVPVPIAAAGGEVRVRPLIGEAVVVKIPPHTNHGKVLRLKGLGLPSRTTRQRGDLLLEVALRFPEPFTEEDDRLYEKMKAKHQDTGGEIYAPR